MTYRFFALLFLFTAVHTTVGYTTQYELQLEKDQIFSLQRDSDRIAKAQTNAQLAHELIGQASLATSAFLFAKTLWTRDFNAALSDHFITYLLSLGAATTHTTLRLWIPPQEDCTVCPNSLITTLKNFSKKGALFANTGVTLGFTIDALKNVFTSVTKAEFTQPSQTSSTAPTSGTSTPKPKDFKASFSLAWTKAKETPKASIQQAIGPQASLLNTIEHGLSIVGGACSLAYYGFKGIEWIKDTYFPKQKCLNLR